MFSSVCQVLWTDFLNDTFPDQVGAGSKRSQTGKKHRGQMPNQVWHNCIPMAYPHLPKNLPKSDNSSKWIKKDVQLLCVFDQYFTCVRARNKYTYLYTHTHIHTHNYIYIYIYRIMCIGHKINQYNIHAITNYHPWVVSVIQYSMMQKWASNGLPCCVPAWIALASAAGPRHLPTLD